MPRTFGIPHEQPVSFEPARVTAVVCVYIPKFSGYFLERLSILEVCLESMRVNAGESIDIMVTDNGSHPKVKLILEKMVTEGKIQHLISHSQNLGKGRALNMAFRAVRSEYIAYSDDDILFFPNWLVDQLKIHQSFPKVGIVGGQPVPDDIGHESGRRVAEQYSLKCEPYHLSEEQIRIWAKSIGYTLDQYLTRDVVQERLKRLLLLESNGIKAVTGCAFYQGLLRRDFVDAMPPFREGVGVGSEDVEWRQEAEARGYLLLNTTRRVTHHLGNRVDEEDQQLVASCGLQIRGAPAWRKALDMKEWEYRIRGMPGFDYVRSLVRLVIKRGSAP